MTTRAIGIIGNDGLARQAAAKISVQGRRVLLYVAGDRTPQKSAKLIEHAATPTDIGFDCEVVLSFVDDSTALKDLLIGTPERLGLGAEMNPGAVFVDFGVRPPRETQALLGVTGMRGVAIVDAAIVGETDSALASAPGTVWSVLVGGFPDAVDQVAGTLALLGRLDRTGPLGSAHTAAALMGYMEAAHRIAHEEAASVGRALGLNGETLSRVLDAPHGPASADNIVSLTHRTRLALKLATDRGLKADVIDFTGARLALQPKSGG